MADNGATILVMKIITIVVAVLMIATVALPAIENAQTEIKTETQNTSMTYNIANNTDAFELTINANNDVVVGDYVVDTTASTEIIAISDSFIIRHYTGSSPNTVYIDDYANSLFSQSVSAASFSGTSMTYTKSGTDYTCNYTWLMIASEDGDYGYFYRSAFNFNADSEIYTFYWGNVDNAALTVTQAKCICVLKGKMGDFTSTWCFTNTAGVTFDGDDAATLSITSYTEGSGCYTMPASPSGTISVDATTPSGTYSKTDTWAFFAPLKYTYTSASDSSMINLLGVIPILLILVPVMMAVRMMTLKRN